MYNKWKARWEDWESKQHGVSKNECLANIKRNKLNIPKHPFLSNRYVLNKMGVEE